MHMSVESHRSEYGRTDHHCSDAAPNLSSYSFSFVQRSELGPQFVSIIVIVSEHQLIRTLKPRLLQCLSLTADITVVCLC